jgi:hypothetical protein
MVQVIEQIKVVEVGTLGNICTPAMLRVSAYQGVDSGKFYGVTIDHCLSGDDQKPRKIMFSDLDTLEKIADVMSNKQEELRSL